ncbi:hypothetical protein PQ455_01365 [Sphingomonas naphthae]|uniref:Uncharacterized protein n=1 Tax=Sphingomonas naphthae TaxID=1813468 RepID=A0ABY7TL28_9SPHN|nr:hypothetical protein [Sphingomonas naphthae]WCT73910.1 hypothetical protein PQ455_01365 [Sphingomonas naphthae]
MARRMDGIAQMITKVRTFSASKFLAAAREAREDAVSLFEREGGSKYIANLRDAYRFVMDEDDYMVASYFEAARTAGDLRAELHVAASNAYTAGASEQQIDRIVTLCTSLNDFAPMGYTRLTTTQADNLINDLLRNR